MGELGGTHITRRRLASPLPPVPGRERSRPLNVLSNGKQTATLDNPAVRSARKTPFRSLQAVEQNGDVYTFPVELGPYLGRTLDKELFNLTKLVEQGYSDKASTTTPVIVKCRADSLRRPPPAAVTKSTELETINAIAGRERSKADCCALRRRLLREPPPSQPLTTKELEPMRGPKSFLARAP